MENKRQHYVPQFYLRQFSGDETDRVLVCLISPYRCVGLGPIRGQCKGDFFYGKESYIDEMLTDTEKKLAPTLYEVNRKREFSEAELQALRLLAVQLHLRTKKAADLQKVFPRFMADQIIRTAIKRGELPPPPSGKWSRDMMDFRGVPETVVGLSLLPCYLETATLRCKLLIAPDRSFFITSDHPAVALNQFAADARSVRSYVGFAQAGFQLVLPLGPSVCAFFYDPTVYKVGNRNDMSIEVRRDDVEILNALQVQSGLSCLYTHRPEAEPEVGRLVARYAKLRKSNDDAMRHYKQNEKETLIMVGPPGVKIISRWQFCAYIKDIKHAVGDRRDPAGTYMIHRIVDDIERNRDGADLEARINRIEGSMPDNVMISRRASLLGVRLPSDVRDWQTGYPN